MSGKSGFNPNFKWVVLVMIFIDCLLCISGYSFLRWVTGG